MKSLPPQKSKTNVMKQILRTRWPLYPGGYAPQLATTKKYGPVPGTNVPLTITYNRTKKRNISILTNVKNLEVGETYLFLIESINNVSIRTLLRVTKFV